MLSLIFFFSFVYDENEHDAYNLTLGISQSDPLYMKRTQLLEHLGLKPTHVFLLNKRPDPIDGELLAFSRIFNMNEGKLWKINIIEIKSNLIVFRSN